ncbi:hypothetical protein PI125_g11862 [Phytophthora idaei]|nr:hypothetical protein PI125_g11862 [Phytophthora idaei]KAG3151392.1 hypothetical protein PI126_g11034 [Phytophthora idaei]
MELLRHAAFACLTDFQCLAFESRALRPDCEQTRTTDMDGSQF